MLLKVLSMRFLIPLILVALSGFFACAPQNEEQTSYHVPSASNEAELATQEAACLAQADYICQTGLSFVQLGDSLKYLELSENFSTPEQEILTGEGVQWLSLSIPVESGTIVLESEYLEDKYPAEWLAETTVNRIRIESSAYQTPQRLRVGDSVDKLIQTNPDGEFLVIPIPDYETISVRHVQSQLNYLFRDPQNSWSKSHASPYQLRFMPAKAEIYAIVVM